MNEAVGRTLKTLERDIEKMGPLYRHLNQELQIVRDEIETARQVTADHCEPIRVILARQNAAKRRYGRYKYNFSKFSRKLDSLRVRLDAIDVKNNSDPEAVAALNKMFTAILDGSHRMEIKNGTPD